MKLDAPFSMIKHAIDSGRLANAYLITGDVRGAAMELALRILQTLFCTAPDTRPCGRCDNCRLVPLRGLADIHWIFPEKKSRVISATQMREQLIEQMSLTSLGGEWKAGVLVGADRLNDSSANIFLKTLEEPPPRTLFLLLSDAPQQLLPTIVSRCQRIDIAGQRELAEPWRGQMTLALASPLLRSPAERLAAGSALYATLSELKERAEQLVAEEDGEAEALDNEDKDERLARVSARYRELRHDFTMELSHWFRDLLVLKAGAEDALVRNQRHIDLLRERGASLTLAQALANLGIVEDLARQLERSLPEESLLGYAMDRLHHGVVWK